MSRRSATFALAGALLLMPPALAAQAPSGSAPVVRPASTAPRVMRAARRDGAIVLDGVLDEGAWQKVEPSSGFTESYPNAGRPSPERSEVRVLYDDQALWVGIRMYDAHPDSIASQLARRDVTGIYSDWVHLIIDSYHDRRTAFRFTVNPRGVKKDVYTSNDGNEDTNWDAVWEVGTKTDSLGWVAEYRIPLSQLRFGGAVPGAERVWGFQVMRDIARRQQRDSWAPWQPQDPGFVSRFGDLAGLVDLPSPTRLELLPYVSSTVTRAPGDRNDPFYSATETKPSAGADLRYGLPKGLTLTATVNPDFGQVEVDPAVVNLSAYETFFPEKRPFFLEGSDIFSFGEVSRSNDYGSHTFFYSRRVGRAPQVSARSAVPSLRYADVPDQATIAGAAKVTGKAGPWTIGLLDAVTTRETAEIETEDGDRVTTPVEPLSNYLAGRVRRDLRGGETVIGGMMTSALRRLDEPSLDAALRRQATFYGLDFEHGMKRREWIVSGFAAGTRIAGSRSAMALAQTSSARYFQRPDADYLDYDPTRESLDGQAAEIAVARNGQHVFGSLAVKDVSPGFELNDLGFISRTDYRAVSPFIGWQDFQAGKAVRNWNTFVYSNYAWNHGGDKIFDGYGLGSNITFRNLWSASLSGSRRLSSSDDRLTRGGPVVESPGNWSLDVSVSSDSRRLAVVSPYFSVSRDASGLESRSGGIYMTMRPSSFIMLTLGPSFGVSRSGTQYVRSVADPLADATYDRRYVFGTLRQTTAAMETRVEWTFTPTLSFQMYAQPFVSAVHLSRFKELERARSFDFAEYGRDRGTIEFVSDSGYFKVDPDGGSAANVFTFEDQDFNQRSLRGNAVLRWEYRPGSAIFVVWQQERFGEVPTGQFDARRDIGEIFRGQARNVLLVKATYWLGR